MKWQLGVLFALLITLFGSALGVVYAKHDSRKRFVELQHLQATRDELNIEWGQLQLEQSTWGTHARIEELARTKLQMDMPNPEKMKAVGYE